MCSIEKIYYEPPKNIEQTKGARNKVFYRDPTAHA